MSEHPNVYDMAYGVCIIIFPNPTMMTTGQWDFYICCAVVLLSRLRILGRGRFDSKGQLISKGLFGILEFFQKMNGQIGFQYC